MTDFALTSASGMLPLTTTPGRPLFILGRNGTGKSALVHSIFSQTGNRAAYLPGNRTAIFDGEGLNLTPSMRRQLTTNLASWDSSPDTRWRNNSGNARNEKAIHDLTVAENQYKNDLANAISENRDVAGSISMLQAKSSPLDKVNLLLEQANMPIRIVMREGEIKTVSGGNYYSFARMSDGERTALILIAEVLAAPDGALLIIDEPELHLHRSIVVPLVGSLIKTRPTCEFIVSTHELELPSSISSSRVLMIRSVTWSPAGSVSAWDMDLVENVDELPEDLRIDILGSRRLVLFTEGDDLALDVPMYSALFPGVSVRPKGGCRSVQQAVAGIAATTGLHHTTGFGLVDNDGMSPALVAKLQSAGVFALSVFSVESLYYDVDVVTAVAERQAATLTPEAAAREAFVVSCLAEISTSVIGAASASGVAEDLAGRLAERQVRDAFLTQLPKREDLISGVGATITLEKQSPYPAELARLQSMIMTDNAFGIISRYPVRHSGILTAVARALKFQNRGDYERAALTRVSTDEPLREKLLAKLEPLTTTLRMAHPIADIAGENSNGGTIPAATAY